MIVAINLSTGEIAFPVTGQGNCTAEFRIWELPNLYLNMIALIFRFQT